MRYRIKDYTITGTTSIQVNDVFTKEDVRLIVNETQKVVIGSSMKKDKFDVYSANGISTITFDGALCQLQSTDQLTIEIDRGDDLSSVESKVDVVGNKIDKVDTTELAKQGNNPEATNTKILEETLKVSDTLLSRSVKYDKQTGNLTIENVELTIE